MKDLFKELNRKLKTLCDSVRDIDPTHKLAQYEWEVDYITEDEVKIIVPVTYVDGPEEFLCHETFTPEGMAGYLEMTRVIYKETLVREETRRQYERALRRDKYLELHEEFKDTL